MPRTCHWAFDYKIANAPIDQKMHVRSANACFLDFDEDVVIRDLRDGSLLICNFLDIL
ncbi:hypothetical protein BD779DRAFT_1545482 [Infundibulicybe gibba]|nr:hypothetical protein BD779DRAFT_1545482 [Infundibulicybe gibba]